MTSASNYINIPGAIWDNPVEKPEYPENTDDFVVEADDLFRKATIQTRARDIRRINQYRTITVEQTQKNEDPNAWDKIMGIAFFALLVLGALIAFAFL